MINKYIDKQEVITNLLLNSLKKDKIVQAYMFYSKNIDFLIEYAKDFSKDLITDEDNEIIYKKIDNNEYEELVFIEPINNMIKIDQIKKLKEFLLTKPVIGKRKIYIIKNCEKLNVVAANAMLKFIEESEENIIGIFLTTNLESVIPTIKSRCQILNFKTEADENYSFLTIDNEEKREEILNNSLLFIEELIKNNINIYYKEKELLFDRFKEKNEIENLIQILLYFYYDVFLYKINGKTKYYKKENELKLIEFEVNKEIDNIMSIIFIVENIKNDYKYNLNTKLLFDRIIIEISEVENGIC